MIDDLEEALLPKPDPKTDGWHWATVTQVSPLRIRLDRDAAALLVTPNCLVDPVLITVGARARVHIHAGRATVIGVSGGGVEPVPEWTSTGLTYGNGVTALSSYAVEYMREGNWINMRGLVQRASGWAAGSTYTAGITMPSGSRIDRDDFFIATSASGNGAFPARVKVNANGTIDFRIQSAQTNTGDYYSLNNVRYWSPV